MKQKFAQMIIRNDSLVQAPNDIISGYARGYYTVVQFANNASVPIAIININAKEGSYAPTVPVQQFLTELKTSNKHIISANYIDSRIEISLRQGRAIPFSLPRAGKGTLYLPGMRYPERADFKCCQRRGKPETG